MENRQRIRTCSLFPAVIHVRCWRWFWLPGRIFTNFISCRIKFTTAMMWTLLPVVEYMYWNIVYGKYFLCEQKNERPRWLFCHSTEQNIINIFLIVTTKWITLKIYFLINYITSRKLNLQINTSITKDNLYKLRLNNKTRTT